MFLLYDCSAADLLLLLYLMCLELLYYPEKYHATHKNPLLPQPWVLRWVQGSARGQSVSSPISPLRGLRGMDIKIREQAVISHSRDLTQKKCQQAPSTAEKMDIVGEVRIYCRILWCGCTCVSAGFCGVGLVVSYSAGYCGNLQISD